MPAIKHILFPVDFSERCQAAAPNAAFLAKKFGARITLLHVVQPYWYSLVPEPAPIIVDVQELRKNVEEGLSKAFVTEFSGLEVERLVEVGEPADTITQFAESHGVDLIVMPTHGYGRFRQFLLGSVTGKVLHDSVIPVWTNSHAEKPPQKPAALGKILCAVATGSQSEGCLKFAAQLAKDSGAALSLVHAIPMPGSREMRQLDEPFEQALANDARESITAMKRNLGIDAPLIIVLAEDIPAAVSSEAKAQGADVVVVGRGVIHERLGRLRTNALGIIRSAPCPVLSV